MANAAGFMNATRQNDRFVATKSLPTGSGQVSFTMPAVGFLSYLILEIAGTIKVAHASNTTVPVGSLSPWNLIQRLRLTANNGITIVDVSGFGLFLENMTRASGSLIDTYSANDYVYRCGAVASSGGTTNNVNMTLMVPLTLNDRDLLGLFLLQNPQTVLDLKIDFNDPTASGTLYDTSGGGYTLSLPSFTCSVNAEYFSVPADSKNYPPIDAIITTVESFNTFSTTGTNEFVMQKGNVLTKLIAWHTFNGALSADNIDHFELQYNQSENPYYLRPQFVRRQMRDMYGRIFPAGVYALDLNHQGVPQLGTSRDWINTAAISDLRFRTNVTGGTPVVQNLITQQVVLLEK